MDNFICLLTFDGATQFPVLLPDGTQTLVDKNKFGDTMVALCENYENYSVTLIGNPAYTAGFAREIATKEKQKYDRNIIHITRRSSNE